MSLVHEQVMQTEKLSEGFKTFDAKNKGRYEEALKKAGERVIEGKKTFDELKLLGGPNLWEEWGKFEALMIERRKISEDYTNKKEQIAIELRALTRPVIRSYCEDLLKEVRRIDGLKKFETIDDKEDVHSERQGSRVFSCNHNFFKCHSAQKEIMAGINSLKGSELESLATIRDKYNSIVEAIPSEFPFELSEGNERLREFFFENKPTRQDVDLSLTESIWLTETVFLSELDKKVQAFKAKQMDGEVGKLMTKRRGPIEIDMT